MKKQKMVNLFILFSNYKLFNFMVIGFIINPKFKYNNNFFPQNKIGYYQEFSKKGYEKLNFNSYKLVLEHLEAII